jgi:hypothetical protein
MPEPTKKFSKGDSVKVKAGVMCPDHKDLWPPGSGLRGQVLITD